MTIEYYKPTEAEQRLIDALRSGEYKQGTGYLERGGRLCCLGVACRVSRTELPISGGATIMFGVEEVQAYLPEVVQTELGWSTERGELNFVDRLKYEITLDELNDEDFSFNQIADIIEAGLVRRTDDLVAA